ncbi:MAG: HNH endonuclease [Verrucomicrobiota bacterium]
MNSALRAAVRLQAGGRCEYCRLPDDLGQLDPFHLEHIVPRLHGGRAEQDNLAWACARCNRRKGTNLSGVDPDSGEVTALFHPRRQVWLDHFRWVEGRILGLTPVGRTTAWLLDMNAQDRREIRRLLKPPDDNP